MPGNRPYEDISPFDLRLRFHDTMSPITLPQPLTSFACGVVVQLAFLALLPAEAARLRELGIREGCPIHILRNHDSLVCGVDASRVVLRKEVAQNVFAVLQPA
jgi:Fe2+ transport system protein FeoA